MNTLAIHSVHKQAGANFIEMDGTQVVAGYGEESAVDAQRRIKKAGGFIDRSYRGKLRVEGPDAEALIQSLTSADVARQTPGTVQPNAICTGHGKAQSLFDGYRFDDYFLLDLDPVLTGSTHAFLDKYTIIRDAATADVSADFGHVGLYGPEAQTVLAMALGIEAADLPAPAGKFTCPDSAVIAATDEFGVAGFEVMVPVADFAPLWEKLVQAGAPLGVTPFGFDALEALRIAHGRARYGVEVDEEVLLLEAGFADSVAFDKGCYIGQETLSRIVFRGQLNRKLCGLVIDGPVPDAGAVVNHDGAEVGMVKSAAVTPDGVVALASLKRACWEPGTAVTVGEATATVADLPLLATASA